MAAGIPRTRAELKVATVERVIRETPQAVTLQMDVPDWPGHRAGQHVEVRLTAEDGYRAERSYSLASPPEVPALEITVERLEDGEVSPFLTDQLSAGDTIELRGPIGRYFAWSASDGSRPLLLIAGGSGIVPLMCMLRHRRLAASTVPAALLYSARSRDEVIYRDELAALSQGDAGVTVHITLTRDREPGWTGGTGRIGTTAIQELLRTLGGEADSFVCGGDGFVEAASALLVEAGQPREAIRTERFGQMGA